MNGRFHSGAEGVDRPLSALQNEAALQNVNLVTVVLGVPFWLTRAICERARKALAVAPL